MIRWYVAHTHAQAETKAAVNLLRQGFAVYLPRYSKLRRHARKREWILSPLFPRYLFVAIDLEKERWRAVQSTIGVSHLICIGERPVEVPDLVIRQIREREDANGNVVVNRFHRFRVGDRIQILSGAFADRTSVFEADSDGDRVRVLLELLGREVHIEVPIDAVTALT